ncbi:GNAT family N-acetyltransferase [Niveispirillum fermenti]|uniref:GNAT family N-acetyltransferase n=1 Tax=Niveispirillum fermenti TaxID=1233113 RepID=UPI003A893F48
MSDAPACGVWEVRRDDGCVVSSDPARLDFDFIHRSLASSYWSPGISREKVVKAARHSVPVGLYLDDGRQAGYCRIVTDHTTFAYLADVWIDPGLRGGGFGKFLVGTVVNRPEWMGLRRFLLFTVDAHGLYRHYGFRPLDQPDRAMWRPAAPESALPLT